MISRRTFLQLIAPGARSLLPACRPGTGADMKNQERLSISFRQDRPFRRRAGLWGARDRVRTPPTTRPSRVCSTPPSTPASTSSTRPSATSTRRTDRHRHQPPSEGISPVQQGRPLDSRRQRRLVGLDEGRCSCLDRAQPEAPAEEPTPSSWSRSIRATSQRSSVASASKGLLSRSKARRISSGIRVIGRPRCTPSSSTSSRRCGPRSISPTSGASISFCPSRRKEHGRHRQTPDRQRGVATTAHPRGAIVEYWKRLQLSTRSRQATPARCRGRAARWARQARSHCRQPGVHVAIVGTSKPGSWAETPPSPVRPARADQHKAIRDRWKKSPGPTGPA